MTREKAYEIIDRCPICTECDGSFPYNCDECGEAFLTAFDALKQPEIVRCKDCKHHPHREIRNGCHVMVSDGKCPFWDKGIMKKDDYYCADGERKDELV